MKFSSFLGLHTWLHQRGTLIALYFGVVLAIQIGCWWSRNRTLKMALSVDPEHVFQHNHIPAVLLLVMLYSILLYSHPPHSTGTPVNKKLIPL